MSILRALVCISMLMLVSACASNGAWSSDLLSVRKPVVAGFRPGADRLTELERSGAVQWVGKGKRGIYATGFAEGDLRDVIWILVDGSVKSIIGVPRLPPHLKTAEAQAAHFGLQMKSFYGNHDGDVGRTQIYTTDRETLFLEVFEGRLVGIHWATRPRDMKTWMEAFPDYVFHPLVTG